MTLSILCTPDTQMSTTTYDHTKGGSPDQSPVTDLQVIPFAEYLVEHEQRLDVPDDNDAILQLVESYIEGSAQSSDLDVESVSENRAPSPGPFVGIRSTPNAGSLQLRQISVVIPAKRNLDDDILESTVDSNNGSTIKPPLKKQRILSKSSKKSQQQSFQTTEREKPCLNCVKDAISGRSYGECYDSSLGPHCYKCNTRRKCEPIPGHAVFIAKEYLRLKRLDGHQATIKNYRTCLRVLLHHTPEDFAYTETEPLTEIELELLGEGAEK
ncbi:hypothetical protein ACMFMG_012046 [Clarireedia jacksonii]